MTPLDFLNVLSAGFLAAFAALAAARRSREMWTPFPYHLLAAGIWMLGAVLALLEDAGAGGGPLVRSATGAAGAVVLVRAAVAGKHLPESTPVKAAVAVLFIAVNGVLLSVYFLPRMETRALWGLSAAGLAASALPLAAWAASKADPPHFLTQSFLFLFIASCIGFLPPVLGDGAEYARQLYALAAAFAFFSLVMHAGEEPVAGSAFPDRKKLSGILIGYLSTFHAYLCLKRELAQRKNVDPVTRLQNFSAFQQALNAAIREADKNSTRFALVFFDIDHFSSINDLVGFETGDRILRTLGEGMLRLVGPRRAGRIGGDEFAAIIHDNEDSLHQNIERILHNLHAELESAGGATKIKVHAAYAIYPYDFFEQSGVFRRMRAVLGASGAPEAPVRVKSG
ncbi:MAG: GGDEF domain-containing protein [bacterium]